MIIETWAGRLGPSINVGKILFYGLIARLLLLLYCLYHDSYINHIKYTDIDYHVFTNGSRAIANGQSPFADTEYRYSPLVALIFVPNILVNEHLGKLMLILADIVCGHLLYLINIHQGTYRQQSKLALIFWLVNPVTLAISTRGSFEPILSLVILLSVYLLTKKFYIVGGILFGLSIHLKLYPSIYSIAFYGYMIHRKPILPSQRRISYWLKTLSPNFNQLNFFLSAGFTLMISCYASYRYYGHDYIEQSFLYHLRRKDFQHNFSVYFYLFKLLPKLQNLLSGAAFVIQIVGVIALSLIYIGHDVDPKIKLRKVTFSLFCTTFYFVSVNKVCTSQYFSWYLTYLPLIIDSLTIDSRQAVTILFMWLLAQVNWLLFAYLYEYQGYDVLYFVGNSSVLFLISNLWILVTFCKNFDPKKQKSSKARIK